MLATSGLASLALALLAKPADFGIDNTLTLVAVIMTGAFGADLVVDGQDEGFEGAGGGGWIPLTVTVLTFGAAIWAFRRMVRAYPVRGPLSPTRPGWRCWWRCPCASSRWCSARAATSTAGAGRARWPGSCPATTGW